MFLHFKSIKSSIGSGLSSAGLIFLLFIINPHHLIGQAYQTEYTIQISVFVTPPYTPYVQDYINEPGKMHGSITNSGDFVQTLQLGGSFTNNQDISIYTDINLEPSHTVTVMANSTINLTENNIQEIFSPDQLVYEGITEEQVLEYAILPEGNYQICIKAYDPYTKMPLSAEGTGCSNSITITAPGNAIITQPECGAALIPMMPQGVIFSWIPPGNATISTHYTLKINEVYPGENINDAMASSHPTFFETVIMMTSYLYGPADPPLIAGKQYAFVIISSDSEGNIIFENNGWSEICEFNYGYSVAWEGDTTLNWEIPSICPVQVGTRLHIEEDVSDEQKVKAKTVSSDPEHTGIPVTIPIKGGSELKYCETIEVTEMAEGPNIDGVTGTECNPVVGFKVVTDQVCLCTIENIELKIKEGKNYFQYKILKPTDYKCSGSQKDCPLCAKRYVTPKITWKLVLPDGLLETIDKEGNRHITDLNGTEVGLGKPSGSEFTLFYRQSFDLKLIIDAYGLCCDGTVCKSEKEIDVKCVQKACVCSPDLSIGPIKKFGIDMSRFYCEAKLISGCDQCRCDIIGPVTFDWELLSPNGIKLTGRKVKVNGVSHTFDFPSTITEGTLKVTVSYTCKDKDKICKPIPCTVVQLRRFKIKLPQSKIPRPVPPTTKYIICGRIGFGGSPGSVVGVAGAVPGGAQVKVLFPGGAGGWTTAEDDGSFQFSVALAWIPLSATVWYLQDDGNLSPPCTVDGPAPPSGEGKAGAIACGLIGFGSEPASVVGLPGSVPGDALVRVAFSGGVCEWVRAAADGSFSYSVVLAWIPLSAKVWFLQDDGDLSPVCIVDGPPPPSGDGKPGDIDCSKIGFGTRAVTVIGLPGAVPAGALVRVSFSGGVDGWTTAVADGSFFFEINLGWTPLSARVCFLRSDGNLSRKCIVAGPPGSSR